MKLKVTSDGQHTRVVDAATGEPLGLVTSIRFEHEAGDIPKVTITLLDVELELDGVEAEIRGEGRA